MHSGNDLQRSVALKRKGPSRSSPGLGPFIRPETQRRPLEIIAGGAVQPRRRILWPPHDNRARRSDASCSRRISLRDIKYPALRASPSWDGRSFKGEHTLRATYRSDAGLSAGLLLDRRRGWTSLGRSRRGASPARGQDNHNKQNVNQQPHCKNEKDSTQGNDPSSLIKNVSVTA